MRNVAARLPTTKPKHANTFLGTLGYMSVLVAIWRKVGQGVFVVV